MWTLLIVALSTAIVRCSAEIGSYDYDNKIEENAINDRDNLTSNVYVLPEQIFNDGKPFYVKKDASGTIDFNAKTTPESLPAPTDAISTQNTANSSIGNENSTRKHDISLDNTVRAHNIHDFLNLPVKYHSSKFVYPLVSSSYANLKYQGNNKNYISNHKADSSTTKSVAYTTKKYNKSTYSTKAYSTSFASKSSTTESYESTTKATPITANSTRKYANIPSRSSTPGRRYTTLSRISSTTVRNNLPNTDFKHTRGRSTTTTTTTTQKPIESHDNSLAAPISTQSSAATTVVPDTKAKNTTENTKEADGMNISDFFGYFFNNNDNNNDNNDNNEYNEYSEETEATKPTTRVTTKATPSTTVMTLRPAISTTHAPAITKQNDSKKVHSNRYDITMDSATRKPINRTYTSEPNTSTTARPVTEPYENRIAYASTASPLIAEYGDKTTAETGKFRPPTNVNVNNIRVSPGAQTATFVTNGQVSTGFASAHPYNEQSTYKGQFQPPAQSDMNSIVVLPDSNSASFVATGQLQTTNHFEQRPAQIDNVQRPVANVNVIDETTKAGITFISKGQVTSAEVYDRPGQNNVVFHAPASNSNNIVIAPGMKTASFVTSSHMSMGVNNMPPQNQPNRKIENEISAFGPGLQSTQRPHGFQLPSSTTAIPKPVNTVIAQSITNETQHIRFPENGENAEKLVKAQPEATSENNIKFPANDQQSQQQPIVSQQAAQAPVGDGLIKFSTDVRNEITDGIDPNNYKQIIQNPNMPTVNNFVVFRPQPSITMQQPPILMGMNVPTMIRNTPFVFKKPTFVHYPRKNYTLPNILPQFRPTQPQQPPIALTPEIANQLRQGQLNRAQYLYNTQNLRFKTPMQYMYGQRPMQIRPSVDQLQNRRHFELHPGNLNQRIYDRPMVPQLFNRNAIGVNANALLVEPQRFEENMKVTATNGDMDGNKNVDFENGDGKLISVQPIVESLKDIPKVEPVTTLQMIQQQRQIQKTGAIVAMNGLSGNGNGNRNATLPTDSNSKTEKPLYVVYPMQKQSIAAPNTMQRGNGEIATILADPMHKPATIQQLGLPYTLEKNKSRYILNSRPAYEFEKKSERHQDPIAAENDEEDR